MRDFSKRLQRLEKQFGPAVESAQARNLRRRLEIARLRCGVRPISPERQAELGTLNITEILHSGREQAALKPNPPKIS